MFVYDARYKIQLSLYINDNLIIAYTSLNIRKHNPNASHFLICGLNCATLDNCHTSLKGSKHYLYKDVKVRPIEYNTNYPYCVVCTL